MISGSIFTLVFLLAVIGVVPTSSSSSTHTTLLPYHLNNNLRNEKLTDKMLSSGMRPDTVGVWLGVCADLCRAGLGGASCGPSCVGATPEITPPTASAYKRTAALVSKPRLEVCPLLCVNNMGYPLCGCTTKAVHSGAPKWDDICNIFCETQQLALTGCPRCTPTVANSSQQVSAASSRMEVSPVPKEISLDDKTIHFDEVLGDDDNNAWQEWCNIVCKTGDGGAACNCDLPPFF